MAGYLKLTWKDSDHPILVQPSPKTGSKKVWVTLATFPAGSISPGKAIVDAELAGRLPTTRPTDIKTRWLRSSPDGETKRHAHSIGTESGWASLVPASIETVTEDDLPLSLQMWCAAPAGSGPIEITKVIVAAFVPLALLAEEVS